MRRGGESANRRPGRPSALGGTYPAWLLGVPGTPEGGLAPLVYHDPAVLAAVKARPQVEAARGQRQLPGLDGGQAAGYPPQQGEHGHTADMVRGNLSRIGTRGAGVSGGNP